MEKKGVVSKVEYNGETQLVRLKDDNKSYDGGTLRHDLDKIKNESYTGKVNEYGFMVMMMQLLIGLDVIAPDGKKGKIARIEPTDDDLRVWLEGQPNKSYSSKDIVRQD